MNVQKNTFKVTNYPQKKRKITKSADLCVKFSKYADLLRNPQVWQHLYRKDP